MPRQSNDIHAITYDLWRQALSGDPDGALLVLETIALEDMSVLTADLLARLYIRDGRFVEAKSLWERILQTDPNYPPAANALRRLNSPWLLRAVAKKYSLWFALSVLLLMALYGLAAVFFSNTDGSFALTGVAVLLAVLGVYVAGLFGWAYLTFESLFAVGQNLYSLPTPQRRGWDGSPTVVRMTPLPPQR